MQKRITYEPMTRYEMLPLELKRKVVNFVQAILGMYGVEVPGEIVMIRCEFAGIPEDIATDVIRTQARGYGQRIV